MKKQNSILTNLGIISALSLLALNLSGCSTITGGVDQKVLFTTSLDGQDLPQVECVVNYKDQHITLVTPAKISLPKRETNVTVTCHKDGYKMLHNELVKHQNHLIASAGKGALGGGGVVAVWALPLIAIPIIGPPAYLTTVGVSAAVGGVTSASTDAVIGGGYSLPEHVNIPMVKESKPLSLEGNKPLGNQH